MTKRTGKPFDRAKHLRKIAQMGGAANVASHGKAHMRAIGAAGGRKTAELIREAKAAREENGE